MPLTVGHNLSATTPDDPNYEIRPSHWNDTHAVTLDISATEISGLFSNANGLSFGLSNNSITGSYTVPTQTAFVLSNANGVSFGTNGSTVTATVATNYQSQGAYLTTAALSNHSHGNPTLNLTNLSGTTASNSAGFTLSLSAGNYLTTAMASNRGSDFVQATAAFAGTNASGTIASNGISVSVGNYITTGALSNHSHGNPQLNLTNLSGTTASNSAGFTLSLSAAAPGAGGGIAAAAGTQTGTSGTVAFVNSNGLTFGMSGSTQITASHNGLTTAAQSNHSHGNPTLNLTNLSGTTASASNGFTLSLSAAAPGAGGGATVSVVEIADGGRLTTCAQWNNATYSNRPIFIPFEIDNNLTGCHTIRLFASRSSGTLLVATFFAGLYSRPNATSASLISSTSMNISVSTSAQFSGVRIYDITGLSDLSLPPGRYLLGIMASAAATNSAPLHLMGGDQTPLAGFVLSGTNQTAATATNSHIVPMWGVYTAVSAALPANVNNTQISGGNSVNSPDVYALIKAI